MKTALYIGNFSFPLGNAAGKRVYANGKILKELGYKVTFIGIDKNINKNSEIVDTKNEFDGFTSYNLPYPNKILDWVNYGKTFNALSNFIDNYIDKVDIIIYYGSPSLSLFINKLIKYSKKNNIKVISDCVDWLTIKTSNFLFNIIKWLDNTYQKAYLNKQVDGIIVISNYLENYYKKSGLKIVVIPPLSTVYSKEPLIKDNEVKKIIYAGNPFRKGKAIKDLSSLKDRIDKMVIILNEAKNKGAMFTFHIYGITKEDYLTAIPSHIKIIKNLGKSIVFHGTANNDEVTKNITEADFTILFRDVNRESSAGFPTKVSESISFGTPVLITLSSDLNLYIKENYNGFYFENKTSKENINKLVEILNKKNEEIYIIKKNCTKDNIFYYKKYIKKMDKFIRSL